MIWAPLITAIPSHRNRISVRQSRRWVLSIVYANSHSSINFARSHLQHSKLTKRGSTYVLLGVLCGLVGLLYARGFYGITHLFHQIHLPRWIKPAIGGLLVGLIGLVLPQALGMGYGWVQVSMGTGLLALPLWVIIALPFMKIVTTGLTVGSGSSGGIFGPGMVIGGMLGATVWRLFYHA